MKLANRIVITFLTLLAIVFGSPYLTSLLPSLKEEINPPVHANSIYTPTGGTLTVGTTATIDASNVGSWRGVFGGDDNYWTITRTAAAVSLDVSIEFTNIQLMNANKMIITVEDSNITTATGYLHQICDWTSNSNVDNAADSVCDGGGWRTLHPRKTTYTNTADTARNYEIYNGYFWNTSAAPGTVLSTPLTNFIKTGTNNVVVRTYSTVNAATVYRMDTMQLEMAIDPVYEPAAYVKTNGGTMTGNITDLIGATSTNLTASDANKLTIPMSAISTPLDVYFSFKDVRTFTGANTILVQPEICVSNAQLTVGMYLYNFQTTSWTQVGGTISPSACTTDTEYAIAFNSSTSGGFSINDYISSGEVRFRFLSNGPATVRNLLIDRIYMMVGAVNTNTSHCEISWGTGTATNCSNTRSISEAKTVAPASSWQTAATLEYPTTYYSLDNDDDANNAEYAASQNLSFPITVSSNMSVSAIHYSAKYRSNSTAQTADLQIRDYGGVTGTSGWVNTPGTDTNALTTYGWFDTWNLAEYQGTIEDSIDTVDNQMNLRLRTSAGTTVDPGSRDWSFAMMSIRWVEETNRTTLLSSYSPTGGALITGTEVTTDVNNTGSWKGALGNDSGTNGGSNYWTAARVNPGGINKQYMFDNVESYGANKIIITIEDSNVTTADAFFHQICDWTSSTGVSNAADTECTGGGWRTLNERGTASTVTSDTTKTYEIFDGYFSSRSVTPGTTYSTPISNFIKTTNKRVLIREFSTVASTTQLRTDSVLIEVAIDPIYEATSYNAIAPFAGATTAFISDTLGTTGSDGNKFTVTNTVANPMNFYMTFDNIQTYSGMNTIVVKPEICVSTVALTFNVWIYNFNSTSWEQLNTATVTGTACATDTAYAYAKNNVTISNYINSGEARVRFSTTVGNTNTFQMDRIYMILGSTNTDSALCEISFGTGTATNCANTRTVADVEGGSVANTSTWQTTSVLEYPSNAYPLDNDDDANNAEAAFASNIFFPVTLSSGMSVTAFHFAGRFRSNVTTITHSMAARDFASKASTSGLINVGATNALTTYSWSDSWQSVELANYPFNYLDTANNRMNLRMRTTVSTNTTAGTVDDWDFAMVSMRWIQAPTGNLYADIVDGSNDPVPTPSISFSAIDTSFSCQTSTGTFGTSSQKIRVYNDTQNPQWTLSLSATSGPTSLWSAGTPKYDYNDGGGSPAGCGDGGDTDTNIGRLSLDFSSAVITPAAGCSSTGVTFGSNASYTEGSVDSVTLVQASGSAQTGCYWDITNIGVSQKIPSDQASGNYSLSMSLSVVSN